MFNIAFYNTENFFEAFSDFSLTTNKKWTIRRYQEKITKIGYVISNIGRSETEKPPTIIGLAEVENEKVLQDLIDSEHLKNISYHFIYYKSKDARGINIALLYDTAEFKVENSKAISMELQDRYGKPEHTRDILLVTGYLNDVKIHILVNHWPSKRENDEGTEYKRLVASKKVSDIISKLKLEDAEANILVMGDFNDNPTRKSVKQLVTECRLYNPFEALRNFSRGSTNNNRQWHLFDQILLSDTFFNAEKRRLTFDGADIFDAPFLKNEEGKHKGFPSRTFLGTTYHGGYSDHFPVYIILK
ncbi:MAG TPA: hypothetical protein VKY34_00055 [Xanthomarina sp.]|nr:hypothetical protein [Xanthomarina sp.]